jgi:hypothetical protein
LNITTIFMPQVVQPTITVQQLLAILDLVPLNPSTDAKEQVLERIRAERDFVSFFGTTLSPHRQSRISFLMQNPKFQDWFKSMTSQTLVINGMDMASQQNEMVSPLSYMCVMLSQTVSQLWHAYPLAFFCRLHSDPDDRLQGASGLMRSLIAQIVLALADTPERLELGFLSYSDMEAIRTGDVTTLCVLFEELLKRVGVATIFCMLDGIAWFENETHVKGMHMAMQFLNSFVEAVEASSSGLVFKLLVASPIMSEYCKDWFPNRVELRMPGAFLMDDQGFNDMRMLLASQNILSPGMAFSPFQ